MVCFHCFSLEAEQVFMLVEPLAICPDGQTPIELTCIVKEFRTMIPEHWAKDSASP